MNVLERQMIDLLKELKDNYGVFEIKAEFEAEGSRMEELMRLKDVTTAAGLPVILKIGGVEAITDIYNGLAIGVKGLIAPMAETRYALSKFLQAIKNLVPPDNAEDIEFAFNIETITGVKNFDEMLALPDLHLLDGVVFGRVDMTGSMGKNRASVDSEEILCLCQDVFRKARKRNLRTGLGGAISSDSLHFIQTLNSEGLLDKFETRKVVFRANAVSHGDAAIDKAVEFELLWLVSKRRYYSRVRAEDETRIAMLEKRLSAAGDARRASEITNIVAVPSAPRSRDLQQEEASRM